MRKIMALILLSSAGVSFAGNFFNVSGTSSSITISSNIPNHLYRNAGIKINSSGYSLSYPSSECTMNNNGYCLFQISNSASKTFTISGSGSSVSMTLCLNGAGPISCQNYSYTISAPSVADYVYVVNSTGGAGDHGYVSLCHADSSGNLSDCEDSGATSLNMPQSLAVDDSENYAYITNQGSGGPSNGSVTACQINSVTKALSSCTSTSFGVLGNLPQQIAYFKQDSNEYIYMATRPASGSGATIYRCNVSGTSVSSCTDGAVDHLDSSNNITGIAVNPVTDDAYVVDNSNSQIYNCPINPSGELSCDAPLSALTNPEYISTTIDGTDAYIPSYANGIRYYPISSGELTLIGSGSAASSGSFDQPNQATPNSYGTYAFVTNRGDNSVSVCAISINHTFTTCQDSGETFSTPYGVTILPATS